VLRLQYNQKISQFNQAVEEYNRILNLIQPGQNIK